MILGLDFGTTGVRGCLRQEKHIEFYTVDYPTASFLSQRTSRSKGEHTQSPQGWIEALENLLLQIPQNKRQQIQKIILDATSSTVLLCLPKKKGAFALTDALMYSDQRAKSQAAAIAKQVQKLTADPLHAPTNAVLGSTSTLAKVMWLKENHLTPNNDQNSILCHQIDWLNGYFTGQYQITDENNALKLGYNPITRSWPEWITEWVSPLKLPKVQPAGHFLAKIRPEVAQQFDLPFQCQVYCGTTDSIAAFLATGAQKLGDGVTSLGSTLAIKQLTDRPIYQPESGVYSHRLGDLWLVGGASNSGGAVALKYFELDELKLRLSNITKRLDDGSLSLPTGLDYYPLLQKGERFPIFEPNLPPRLTPKPDDPDKFLLGIIEGLVSIEKLAYQKLNQAAASESGKVKQVFSVGGGTKNLVWQQLREQTLTKFLDVKIKKPLQTEAAFGVTQLLSNTN